MNPRHYHIRRRGSELEIQRRGPKRDFYEPLMFDWPTTPIRPAPYNWRTAR